ncbi:hypothetical protein K239x_21500 [Planctomycetes bacterium K23_9]|uniref:Uncharacterized protein n=1 Tax=Stieleria marina TaxID=1930275 RepID=A0A517NSV9_9BACT|nr:hypothetical protein K239x_21500 [Planctomycetes bacterium K23_9]
MMTGGVVKNSRPHRSQAASLDVHVLWQNSGVLVEEGAGLFCRGILPRPIAPVCRRTTSKMIFVWVLLRLGAVAAGLHSEGIPLTRLRLFVTTTTIVGPS